MPQRWSVSSFRKSTRTCCKRASSHCRPTSSHGRPRHGRCRRASAHCSGKPHRLFFQKPTRIAIRWIPKRAKNLGVFYPPRQCGASASGGEDLVYSQVWRMMVARRMQSLDNKSQRTGSEGTFGATRTGGMGFARTTSISQRPFNAYTSSGCGSRRQRY